HALCSPLSRVWSTICDFACQFAALERDGDRVAYGDVRRIADDRRPIAIPTHSIAPREHRERTQALELRGDRAELRLEGVPAAIHHTRQLAFARHESRAHARETTTQVECFE